MTMRAMQSEDGFTLSELLVASVITLAVMGMALSSFSNALRLNDAVSQVADSTQNLRAGTNLLVRDLMQAGRGIPTGGIPIPSGDGAIQIFRPAPPGSTLTFDNVTSTTLSAITTGQGRGITIDGAPTDLVTMLMSDPLLEELDVDVWNAAGTVPKLAEDGGSIDVGAATEWLEGNPEEGIAAVKAGDLILFKGPNGNTIQTVTSVSSPTVYFAPNDPFHFNQPDAEAGSITQVKGVKLKVTRLFMYTYYVYRESSSAPPRLMRALNMFEPQALAGVIEGLTLRYDLVDGEVNPTNVGTLPYTANDVTYSANQIRKANISVIVRAESKSPSQADYVRHHLSTAVSIRNLAYVDRYKTETDTP